MGKHIEKTSNDEVRIAMENRFGEELGCCLLNTPTEESFESRKIKDIKRLKDLIKTLGFVESEGMQIIKKYISEQIKIGRNIDDIKRLLSDYRAMINTQFDRLTENMRDMSEEMVKVELGGHLQYFLSVKELGVEYMYECAISEFFIGRFIRKEYQEFRKLIDSTVRFLMEDNEIKANKVIMGDLKDI